MIIPVEKIHRVHALITALRLRQWIKNAAVFTGLVFSQRLFDLLSLERAALAFIAFCLASSSIYLLNDILDREQDRQHPVKRNRPLASGVLPVSWAMTTILFLLLACAGVTTLLYLYPVAQSPNFLVGLGGANFLFPLAIFTYIIMMVLYSIRLKHVVLIDVFVIAGGFVIRVLAGAVVIPVSISPWLYLVTILLALFLAFNKRRQEIVLLQGQAGNHRHILAEYSVPMLDQMIAIISAATVVTYSLYTFEGPTGNHHLMITIPLVLYGLFRYLYLVHQHNQGGSPEDVLLHDRHILTTVVLFVAVTLVVLYAARIA